MIDRDSHSRSWSQEDKQAHLVGRAHRVMKTVVKKNPMFTNSLPVAPWQSSSKKHSSWAWLQMSHNTDYATQTGRIKAFWVGFVVIIALVLRRISRYAMRGYVKNGAQVDLFGAVRPLPEIL